MSDSCSITVSGMTCAACSGRVQRTLEKTRGVHDASVNLMTGTATVAFDPTAVTAQGLMDAIRETGYGAELPPPDSSADGAVRGAGCRACGRGGRPASGSSA